MSAADTGEEVGMVLTRGFYYIAENYSGRQALKWLLKVLGLQYQWPHVLCVAVYVHCRCRAV